jgi:hypothetical protein
MPMIARRVLGEISAFLAIDFRGSPGGSTSLAPCAGVASFAGPTLVSSLNANVSDDSAGPPKQKSESVLPRESRAGGSWGTARRAGTSRSAAAPFRTC